MGDLGWLQQDAKPISTAVTTSIKNHAFSTISAIPLHTGSAQDS